MGNATHILDMSRSYGFVLRNPCSVEREVCEKYNLNRIDVATIDGVIRKMRKDNDDLKIIMGKTERIDNTRYRLNTAFVPPSPRPYFDDNPDPFGLYYTKL